MIKERPVEHKPPLVEAGFAHSVYSHPPYLRLPFFLFCMPFLGAVFIAFPVYYMVARSLAASTSRCHTDCCVGNRCTGRNQYTGFERSELSCLPSDLLCTDFQFEIKRVSWTYAKCQLYWQTTCGLNQLRNIASRRLNNVTYW